MGSRDQTSANHSSPGRARPRTWRRWTSCTRPARGTCPPGKTSLPSSSSYHHHHIIIIITPNLEHPLVVVPVLVVVLPVPSLQPVYEGPRVSVPVSPHEGAVPILQVILKVDSGVYCNVEGHWSYFVSSRVLVAVRICVGSFPVLFVLPELTLEQLSPNIYNLSTVPTHLVHGAVSVGDGALAHLPVPDPLHHVAVPEGHLALARLPPVPELVQV